MPIRPLVASALFVAAAALSSLGCNFIMNPDGDGVFRCDNPDDCDVPLAAALDDERGQSRCAAPGGGGGGFTQSQDNKVCSVVDREDVGCNANAFAMDEAESSPASKTYRDALQELAAYTCLPEQYGSAGCPPNGGACNSGLEVRSFQSLVGEADNPDVGAVEICAPPGETVVAATTATRGFDVLDQHCRSFFCDDAFVCNRGSGSSSGWRCVRCDPDKPYGNGGCGTMYVQGARSTVYTADLGGDACESIAKGDATDFGPVVQAPETPNP